MAFGKAFKASKEANRYLAKLRAQGKDPFNSKDVRKMSKKLHPRRTKLFHVGTKIDFLNFA